MAATLDLTFKRQRSLQRLLRGFADAKPITFLLPASGVAKTQYEDRIETGKRDPNGNRWRSWSPGYAATRQAHHSIGVDTSEMLETIRRKFKPDRADIYADADHAPHFAKTRPMAGFNQRDMRQVERAFSLRLAEMVEDAFA